MSLPASRLACTSKALVVEVCASLLLLTEVVLGIGCSSSAEAVNEREEAAVVLEADGGEMYCTAPAMEWILHEYQSLLHMHFHALLLEYTLQVEHRICAHPVLQRRLIPVVSLYWAQCGHLRALAKLLSMLVKLLSS